MMNKHLIVFGLFSLSISHPIFANNICLGVRQPHTQHYYGPATCSNVMIHNINVVGSLTTSDGARMFGKTTLTGPLNAKETFFDNVEINNNYSQGEVWLKNNTVIKGQLIFKGQRGTVCLDNSSMIVGGIVNGHVHCYTH